MRPIMSPIPCLMQEYQDLSSAIFLHVSALVDKFFQEGATVKTCNAWILCSKCKINRA